MLTIAIQHVVLLGFSKSTVPHDRPSHAFYLQPLTKPTQSIWYSKKPLGYHNTVVQLCKEAGIPGFKSNHSLRATAATRLYQSGIDEQLVIERTGHRRLEGVRSYKRTTDTQRETLSDILNKNPRIESSTVEKSNSDSYSTTYQVDIPETQITNTQFVK